MEWRSEDGALLAKMHGIGLHLGQRTDPTSPLEVRLHDFARDIKVYRGCLPAKNLKAVAEYIASIAASKASGCAI